MTSRVVSVLACLSTLAFSLTRAYVVEPVRQTWSGWTEGEDGYVSEIVTVNFDKPIYCELFVGEGSPAEYQVNIYSHPDGVVAFALGDTVDARSHKWVRCSLEVAHPDSFIKGRKVEVRWTRSGSDSINYYTAYCGTYPYGYMKVGGQDHSGPGLDNTPTDHTMA